MLLFVSTDHNEGSVPDAEEDASVPEGAQQGVCSHMYVSLCVSVSVYTDCGVLSLLSTPLTCSWLRTA